MTRFLAVLGLGVVVLGLIMGIRYLARATHASAQNTGSASESFNPSDPGTDGFGPNG